MSLPAAFVSVILIWSTTPLAIKWSALGVGFSFAVFALLTPVMALLLGHGLNHEAVLPHVWFGTAFILLGLGMHHWGSAWLAYLPVRRVEK